MNNDQPKQLFISDEAYEGLRQLQKEWTSSSLSLFIGRYLLSDTLYDRRPDDIKEEDSARIAAHIPLEWTPYGPRKRRYVAVTDLMVALANIHAKRIGLYASRRKNALATMSLLLEAIGIGWVSNERPSD